MTKKQILRGIGFILATCLLIVTLCDLFETENTENYDKNMYTYRNLPEDTADAIFYGTSGIDRYWIAPKAYEEHGIASYSLAYDAFPAWLYTNILDETLKMQNPELVVFDARAFYQSNTRLTRVDVRARRYIDSLPFLNINRFKAAFKTMKVLHDADPKTYERFDASYLFSIIKYHSKWSEDYSLDANLGHKEQKYGSFYLKSDRTIKATPYEKRYYDSDYYSPLDKVTEDALDDLIYYIKANDLKVLFVDTPQFLSKYELGRANTLFKILDDNNLDYVHFYKENTSEFAIDLDNTKDFYDESHVNYYGAEKFTEALAAYIDKNYDLPDSRERENAKEFWDGKYDAIKTKIAEYEEKAALKAAEKAEKERLEQEEADRIQQIIDNSKKGKKGKK